MKNLVIEMLKNNPNPTDQYVHEWAEENGFDVHEVEAEIYGLATKFVKFLTQGRSVEHGLTKDDVDQNELAMGIKIELEHINDIDVAEKIALDHLSELHDYYTKLVAMEKSIETANKMFNPLLEQRDYGGNQLDKNKEELKQILNSSLEYKQASIVTRKRRDRSEATKTLYDDSIDDPSMKKSYENEK